MGIGRALQSGLLVTLTACRGLSAFNVDGGPDTDPGGVGPDSDLIDSAGEDTVDPDNTAPVADAGPDGRARTSETVSLDGTGSADADGDGLSYTWTLVKKPAASRTRIVNESSEKAQFWADVDGEYLATLTVSDGKLEASDDATWTIETPNGGPLANAGADQVVAVNDTVQLNGSASSDPDGDTLTYNWQFVTKPTGSFATLDAPKSATPRFVADAVGAYEVQLVVSDGTAASAADAVRVSASDNSSDDCLSSCAESRDAAARRVTRGGLSLTPALVLLPLFAIGLARRKRR